MDWPKPKSVVGPKPTRIVVEAKRKKTIGDYIMKHLMVVGAEGARHHVVRGGRRPPLIMWSLIVFGDFGLHYYFWLWHPQLFWAFGQSIFY